MLKLVFQLCEGLDDAFALSALLLIGDVRNSSVEIVNCARL